MTHDELLALIDYELKIAEFEDSCGDGGHPPTHKALRAVVELTDKDIEHESLAWLSGYCFAMVQVVQAIEKELK